MTKLTRRFGLHTAIVGAALMLTAAVPALAENDPAATQPAPKHHSMMKGAAVGGAGGAVVGGKRGAEVGAVGGAIVQHHKNKKARKAAQQH